MQSEEGEDTEWTLVAPRSSRPACSDGAHESTPPARKRLDRRPPNDGRSASDGKRSVGPPKEGGEKAYTLLRRPQGREREREREKEGDREGERQWANEDLHRLSSDVDAASEWKMVSTATTNQESCRSQSEDIKLKIGAPIIMDQRRRGRRGEEGGGEEEQTGKTSTAGSRTGFFSAPTGDAEECAVERSGPTGFRTGQSSQGRRRGGGGGREVNEEINPQRRGLLVLKKVGQRQRDREGGGGGKWEEEKEGRDNNLINP